MTAPTPSPEIPADIRALIESERAALLAPLRAEVDDAKGALDDASAHEDNDTASVADRIETLADERDFYCDAWNGVLDALYPHRLSDDQFDPKEVAHEIDAIATEAESLRADVERLTRELERERGVNRLRVNDLRELHEIVGCDTSGDFDPDALPDRLRELVATERLHVAREIQEKPATGGQESP